MKPCLLIALFGFNYYCCLITCAIDTATQMSTKQKLAVFIRQSDSPAPFSTQKADKVNTEEHFKRSGGKNLAFQLFRRYKMVLFSPKFYLPLDKRMAERVLISTTHLLDSLQALLRHIPQTPLSFSGDAELIQNPETTDFNRQMSKKPTHLFFTLYKER